MSERRRFASCTTGRAIAVLILLAGLLLVAQAIVILIRYIRAQPILRAIEISATRGAGSRRAHPATRATAALGQGARYPISCRTATPKPLQSSSTYYAWFPLLQGP